MFPSTLLGAAAPNNIGITIPPSSSLSTHNPPPVPVKTYLQTTGVSLYICLQDPVETELSVDVLSLLAPTLGGSGMASRNASAGGGG